MLQGKKQGKKMDMWIFWLCASTFLAGYCIGEMIRLVQTIRAYRQARRG
jgi:hypothetical protein